MPESGTWEAAERQAAPTKDVTGSPGGGTALPQTRGGEGPGKGGSGRLGAEDGHVWPAHERAAWPCSSRGGSLSSRRLLAWNTVRFCARTRKAAASPKCRRSLPAGTERASGRNSCRGGAAAARAGERRAGEGDLHQRGSDLYQQHVPLRDKGAIGPPSTRCF